MSDDFTIADFLRESSKAPADLPIVRRRSTRPHCDHRRVAFDRQSRHTWCRDCEVDLDPFDVIALLSKSWDGVADARQERARLLSEVERLEAEEKRVKARIRTALAGERRKAPEGDGELAALRELEAVARRYDAYGQIAKALARVDAVRARKPT